MFLLSKAVAMRLVQPSLKFPLQELRLGGCAAESRQRVNQSVGLDDGRELAVEIAECRKVNIQRRSAFAIYAYLIKRRRGIRNDVDGKAQICSHTGRRRNAMLGRQAHNCDVSTPAVRRSCSSLVPMKPLLTVLW